MTKFVLISYNICMTTTINISLPKGLLDDAKKMLSKRGYASISELVREALRNTVYPNLTENGFTPEFEDEVLRRDKEYEEKHIYGTWDGQTPFVEYVLSHPATKHKK